MTTPMAVREVDLKALRERLGMTQLEFSQRFCIGYDSLRKWESGNRRPAGHVRVLLLVLEHNPEAVLAAIAEDQPSARKET